MKSKALIAIILWSVCSWAIAETPQPVTPSLADNATQAALLKIQTTFSKFIPRDVNDVKDQLSELMPNSDMFVYVLDATDAGKLGLSFLSADAAKKSTIIIQEYAMYRDDVIDSKQYRIGVGVRMVVTVNEKSAKVGTLSIPTIAANVEKKKMQATVRLQVIGISGKAITEAVPMPSELNFSTLMQMYQSMGAIKANIWASGTHIDPQILAFSK